MVSNTGKARVVEYNVRLGDPETQPLLMRLDSDLLSLLDAATDGTLDTAQATWKDQCALGIVLAAEDYPAKGSTGQAITGIDKAEKLGCKVFHAGTDLVDDQYITSGGRIMCVSALGRNITEAKQIADNGAAQISFSKMHYRRDIGYRAVAREKSQTE